MNFHRSLSVSLFALGLTGMTAAQADTLADAINAALATNPGLQSQRVETDIARESVEQARSQGRTTVDLSGSAGYQYTDSNAAFASLSGTNGDRPIASAQIQIEEAVGELTRYLDHFEADPERQQYVEERLSAIFELARKHRIQPAELPVLQQQLIDELEGQQQQAALGQARRFTCDV